jgi:bifunctional non-homologous end joining protein LigD
MPLKEYRKKRDFSKTPEPAGGARRSPVDAYVIQKHDATRLHYDFRLQHGDVLWSWAVPKGPSLDPREKRLAVQVEDHPLDYRNFEGTIPEGEYGGGTVMIWDRGTWEPLGDPEEGDRAGKLNFVLHGEKLRGRWTLVRMSHARGRRSDKPQWLLIKDRDEEARPLSKEDILESRPESIVTGRTLEQIAAGDPPRRARKKAPKTGKRARSTPKIATARAVMRRTAPPRRAATRKTAPPLPGAVRTKLPALIAPQLATLVTEPPAGEGWLHELKFDGYRMLGRLDRGRVEFLSRNGKSWTQKVPELAEAVAAVGAGQALFDGEVVVLDANGVSNFQLLQNALGDPDRSVPLTYFVFDLLYLNGFDLRPVPLLERKQLLEELLGDKAGRSAAIRYSDHVAGSGAEMLRRACQAGAEGVVSKRADSTYASGRGKAWLKSKCRQGQELVLGAYTDPDGSRPGFGSLLLGYYLPDGKLTYAGRVGTGFSDQTLRDLRRRMARLESRVPPFHDYRRARGLLGVHWLKPELVAQVEFSNWTKDGLVRQAVFQGLRDDKPARAVTREKPVVSFKTTE